MSKKRRDKENLIRRTDKSTDPVWAHDPDPNKNKHRMSKIPHVKRRKK